ncbi:hypothetical protein K6Q96_09015 [Grimontia kaedaensis]|uniref:Uncharacterized protein n=1 Tax=Grimontia kaedaensis TaxID=2872157 RepID=A0ABY4WND6_9GAMM|nr:hypothetical protein [Grimontia kaedaensis]USH01081.1 hypothetical protein K6Q96_09015 [Grimontia kaedaensis]
MRNIVLSIEFWKFAAPLFGAIIAWFVNEWRKRVWEQYNRKEESYKELLKCLEGFQQNFEPVEARKLRAQFLSEVNKCWLYCPDDVIEKAYQFLELSKKSSFNNESERDIHYELLDEAVGVFVTAIRQDLLSRKLVRKTELNEKNFMIYRVR